MREVKFNSDGNISIPIPDTTKITVEMSADTFCEFMRFQKGNYDPYLREERKEVNLITESDFENILLRWRSDISLNGTPTVGIFRIKDDDSLECLFHSVSPYGDIGFLEILKKIRGEE